MKPVTAFSLWRAGLCVIPIAEGTKFPLAAKLPKDEEGNGRWEPFQTRKPTHQEIETWFSGPRKTRAWAIVCGRISKLVVVDLDSQEALDWAEAHLPSTPLRVRTSVKEDGFLGRHWYYRHPLGELEDGSPLLIPNRARIRTVDGAKIKLDVRADGGFVLGPGSLHPDGCIYQACQEVTAEALEGIPAFSPSWIRGDEALEQTPAVGASRVQGMGMDLSSSHGGFHGELSHTIYRVQQYLESIPGEGQGGRNNKAFEVAAKISNDFALDGPEGWELFQGWNLKNFPPLPVKELQTTWASARKGAKQPRGNKLDTGFVPNYTPRVYDLNPGKKTMQRDGQSVALNPEEPGNPVWGPPQPLEAKASNLPAFMTGNLPTWGAEMITAVATAYQVPEDLPGLLWFSCLSTALAGKVEFEYRPDWIESANLYCCVAMGSGTRKSPVYSRMVAPIEKYEDMLRAKAEEARSSHEVELRLLKADLSKAERELEGLGRTERSDVQLAHLAALQREIVTMERKKMGDQLYAVDVTPEKLGELLRDNGERMAVLSSEADFFSVLGGRYNRGESNLGLFLEAWSGRPYRVDRKGAQGPIHLKAPLLTLGVTTQPSTLNGIVNRPGWKEIGVPGRLLFALPHDNVGSRVISPPPVPKSIENKYQLELMKLLDVPVPPAPLRLRFEPEAVHAFEEFRAWHEGLLRPDGRLRDLREWGAKLPGQLIRLCGLIHCAETGLSGQISLLTVYRVLDLAAHLIEHACAVFLAMGADATYESARKVLAWINRSQPSVIAPRDVLTALRREFERTEDVKPILEFLEGTGHLKAVLMPGKQGRPVTRYLVNPCLISGILPSSIVVPEPTFAPEFLPADIPPEFENGGNEVLPGCVQILPDTCLDMEEIPL